jgi:hypothetical protein
MQAVNPPKKSFLVKPRVGCVRTTTYDLPEDQNHVYGYVKPPDEMRCGEIMSSWVAADPSAGKVGTRSYVHSNILAIRNGCITASAMRQYIDQHPNIRLKEEAQDNMNSKGNHEGPFGVQTKFADETMKGLMQASYTNFVDDDSDYPDTSNIMKMSSFPMPIPTKASELLMSKRREEKEKANTPTKHFCMKKFQGVESKLFKELNLTPSRKRVGSKASNNSNSGTPTKFQSEVQNFRLSGGNSVPQLLSPPMN